MKRCYLLLGLLAALAPAGLLAQTIDDARRFSEHGATGTARSIGMGGAFSAVGGDVAALTLNPAGLGLYRGGEFNFTPALQLFGTRASFLGEEQASLTSNLSIAGLGLVLHFPTYQGKGLQSINFGFGLNQLQQHRRRLEVEGFNPASSVTNYLAERASGIDRRDLERVPRGQIDANQLEALAFQTGYAVIERDGQTYDVRLIDNIAGSDFDYFGAYNYGQINQAVERFERGRTNEWDFSLGFNIDERVYLGATLGILDVNWRLENLIRETDVNRLYVVNSRDTIASRQIDFRENVVTSGTGVNFKLGAIVQPSDALRIGLAFETPTYIWMTDRYSAAMRVEDHVPNRFDELETLENTYDYALITPYRLRAGAALILGKQGLISADVGLVDYSLAEFRARAGNSQSTFNSLNRRIRNEFQLGYEARAGGELRLDDYYLRAGFGYWSGTPADNFARAADPRTGGTSSYNADRYTATFGVGYRTKGFYLDVAYAHQIQTDTYTLYALTQQPYRTNDPRALVPVQTQNRRTFSNIIFTVGLTFGASNNPHE